LQARLETLVTQGNDAQAAFELREALGIDTPAVDVLLERVTETEPQHCGSSVSPQCHGVRYGDDLAIRNASTV
jgi:hypothetical protein